MDISVNKPVKMFLKDKFQNWYAEEMLTQDNDTATKQSDVSYKLIIFPIP